MAALGVDFCECENVTLGSGKLILQIKLLNDQNLNKT